MLNSRENETRAETSECATRFHKSSQVKARQVSTSFVASAPHAGSVASVGLARRGPISHSDSRRLGASLRSRPVRLWSSRPGARGGRRAVRAISGTVTRWSLTTPRHTPHQKSVHHTHTAGKSTDVKRQPTYSENIVGRARVFFHFGGRARPPRRCRRSHRERRSQRPARFTRERHTIAAESSHVSHAPTPVSPPAHHRTRRLLAPASSSGSRGAGAYHQSLSAALAANACSHHRSPHGESA